MPELVKVTLPNGSVQQMSKEDADALKEANPDVEVGGSVPVTQSVRAKMRASAPENKAASAPAETTTTTTTPQAPATPSGGRRTS